MIELKEIVDTASVRAEVTRLYRVHALSHHAVFVASFNPIELYRLRRECSGIATCFLYSRNCVQSYYDEHSIHMQPPSWCNFVITRFIIDWFLSSFGASIVCDFIGASIVTSTHMHDGDVHILYVFHSALIVMLVCVCVCMCVCMMMRCVQVGPQNTLINGELLSSCAASRRLVYVWVVNDVHEALYLMTRGCIIGTDRCDIMSECIKSERERIRKLSGVLYDDEYDTRAPHSSVDDVDDEPASPLCGAVQPVDDDMQ